MFCVVAALFCIFFFTTTNASFSITLEASNNFCLTLDPNRAALLEEKREGEGEGEGEVGQGGGTSRYISGNFDAFETITPTGVSKVAASVAALQQTIGGTVTKHSLDNNGQADKTNVYEVLANEGSFMVDDSCTRKPEIDGYCYYEFCVHNGDAEVSRLVKKARSEVEGGSMDDDSTSGDDMSRGGVFLGDVKDTKVGFSFRVVRDGFNEEADGEGGGEGDKEGKGDGGDAAKEAVTLKKPPADRKLLKSLHASSLSLLESLRTLEDHQSYMRRREADHRDLTELTNSRIQFWTFAELMILVAVSATQVILLKRIFERKRRF